MMTSTETCSRKIHFCYGHRLLGHESKCATLHGHNGIVWVHAAPVQGLDQVGRVVDFSVLKEKMGGWIDKNWDHTTILYGEDKATIDLIRKAPGIKDPYIMNQNPTAENLAKYLLWEIAPQVLHNHHVIVYKIEFYETENCKAEAVLDPSSPEVLKRYGY